MSQPWANGDADTADSLRDDDSDSDEELLHSSSEEEARPDYLRKMIQWGLGLAGAVVLLLLLLLLPLVHRSDECAVCPSVAPVRNVSREWVPASARSFVGTSDLPPLKPLSTPVPYTLLWVHLGPGNFPSHFPGALRQAMLWHGALPHVSRVFITNEGELSSLPADAKQAFADFNVELVAVESLTKSELHEEFIRKTPLSGSYGRGTSERHFIVDNFIAQRKLQNVYHMEADVFLYQDLDRVTAVLSGAHDDPALGRQPFKPLVITQLNDEWAVPGLVFYRNRTGSASVARALAALAGTNANDMISVGAVPHDERSFFPPAPREYFLHKYAAGIPAAPADSTVPDAAWLEAIRVFHKEHYAPAAPPSLSELDPLRFCERVEDLGAVFDNAYIGQWYDGTHIPHIENFHNTLSNVDPHQLSFAWKVDQQQRRVPFMHFAYTDSVSGARRTVSYRIASMHGHTKNVGHFASTDWTGGQWPPPIDE